MGLLRLWMTSRSSSPKYPSMKSRWWIQMQSKQKWQEVPRVPNFTNTSKQCLRRVGVLVDYCPLYFKPRDDFDKGVNSNYCMHWSSFVIIVLRWASHEFSMNS